MSESATVIESPKKANNGAGAPSEGDVAVIDELRTTYNSMKSEMAKVIVGQDEVVERLLIAILAGFLYLRQQNIDVENAA